MPPKTDAAEAQRTKDALWLFNHLMDLSAPISINVNHIARKEGTKANTIAKRFSTMRQRYPGLSIHATSTTGGGSESPKPAAPKPGKGGGTASASKTAGTAVGGRKRKAIEKEDEDVEGSKRLKKGREGGGSAAGEDGGDGAEDAEESTKQQDDGEDDRSEQNGEDAGGSADSDVKSRVMQGPGSYEWQTYAEEFEC